MNPVQLHLALTHVPVVLSIAGFGLLIVALLRKEVLLVTAAYWILIIAAAAALPVYLTGEGTAETLEKLPGISKDIIESHEEAAESAFIAIELVGVLSILGLIFQKRAKLGKVLRLLTLLSAFVAAAILVEAAHLGGQIRHSEIRKDVQL
ncbi:MAG TPA: DUF2231 domain-containing protein [Puia sp.]|jgi:uncharacterized membrane protein|nr:DUF2231 domain-containing protein [Puia sp.]